jgi:NitT/TauT family transport system permease protein
MSEQTLATAATPSTRPRRRRRITRRRILVTLLQLVIVVAIVGSWQLCADQGLTNRLFSSSPSEIVTALRTGISHGQMLDALGVTVWETLAGFALSVVIGTVAGVVLYAVPFLQETFQPFVAAVNSLPRLALAPLFILWFGIGSTGRIALIVTIVSFLILVNTYAGLQNASRDHLLLARTLGASTPQTFVKFMLPSAAPTIFAGLQLGMTYSFLGAVIAELVSGGSGLGAQISSYQSNFETAGMFADFFLIGIVAGILSLAMRLVEKYVLAWRRAELRGVAGGTGTAGPSA